VRLTEDLGGSPATKSAQYVLHSAYSSGEADGGNAKYLKDIPIRLYSEPDLDQGHKTYCDWQFNDINAFDSDGLNKFLTKLDNKNSEYIATTRKGFHSWNIVDAVDCVNWILRFSNKVIGESLSSG